MLVHGSDGGQVQLRADFLQAGRVAVGVDEVPDDVQHLSLPTRECHGILPRVLGLSPLRDED